MSKFKNVKADLKAILEEIEGTKDCNIKLYQHYIFSKTDVETNTALWTFFYKLEIKAIPSMETVSRLSRQIQQQNPHLRGKNWEKRHGQQREVINDLKNND